MSAAAFSASAPRATISTFTPSRNQRLRAAKAQPLLAPPTSAHLPAIPKSMSTPFVPKNATDDTGSGVSAPRAVQYEDAGNHQHRPRRDPP